MLVRMKPKSIVTAYHCKACGAVCRPTERLCRHCQTKYENEACASMDFRRNEVRLLAACGSDYVYFPVKSLTELDAPMEIEATRWSDGTLHRVQGLRDVSSTNFLIVYDSNTLQKIVNMRKRGIVDMRVEMGAMDDGFSFSGYFPATWTPTFTAEANKTMEVSVIATKLNGWIPLNDVPDDVRCPNCGAPIKSRFGCCDYCTGWVEWTKAI